MLKYLIILLISIVTVNAWAEIQLDLTGYTLYENKDTNKVISRSYNKQGSNRYLYFKEISCEDSCEKQYEYFLSTLPLTKGLTWKKHRSNNIGGVISREKVPTKALGFNFNFTEYGKLYLVGLVITDTTEYKIEFENEFKHLLKSIVISP